MGQMTQLLMDLAREVKGVQAQLQNVQGNAELEAERVRKKLDELLQRVTALETDGKWSGKERRKVEERLGSGDHTFTRLQSEIANAAQEAESAYEIAKQALAAAEAARDANGTTKRRGWKEKLKEKALEALVPMVVGIIFWAIYHVLLIGPEIAKLMKKVGEP